MEGWIKLHRQVLNHWIFKNPYYFRAWMYFIIRSNHQDNSILIGSTLIEIKRGEFISSLNNIAADIEMSLQKTRTFLKLLEKENMIIKESTSKLTKITICSYDDYQALQHTNNIPITNEQQTNNKPITTDKNVLECLKNEKTVKEGNKKENFVCFSTIYKKYKEPSKIRVVPDQKSKAYKAFEKYLKEHSFEYLLEQVENYNSFITGHEWRKKKDFTAFFNSEEHVHDDWIDKKKSESSTNGHEKYEEYMENGQTYRFNGVCREVLTVSGTWMVQ